MKPDTSETVNIPGQVFGILDTSNDARIWGFQVHLTLFTYKLEAHGILNTARRPLDVLAHEIVTMRWRHQCPPESGPEVNRQSFLQLRLRVLH